MSPGMAREHMRSDYFDEERSGRIVRVTLQYRAQRTEFLSRETAVCKSIQCHQDSQSDGDTAAEASRLGNISLNRAPDREWLFSGATKKQFRCFRDNSRSRTLVYIHLDIYPVPKAQGGSQTIKTGTEVGR